MMIARGARASAGLFGARLFVLCLSLVGAGAFAQNNAIESVTSLQQGNTTYLRVQLKTAPATPPASFSISNPPRVALDFSATENKAGQSSFEMPQGDVRSVAIVQSGQRSRVVLNLKRAMTYATSIDGNAVVLALTPVAAQAAATPAPTYSFSKADGNTTHALRDLDFRRGKEGEGRVVVELSDSNVGVDIRQQGREIVVDFLRARLPDNLQAAAGRRRLRNAGAFDPGDPGG